MSKHRIHKWTTLWMSLCTLCKLSAQTPGSALDPVTISASFSPRPGTTTGRHITVLSGTQFHRLPVHSIDELLRFVPGIEVQQRGPMGTQSDIVLRGATFGQVLVVLDGQRLNDPNTGHFTAYIPIAPSEIDRIEIVRGAASALYGSEAVGGVVYIITKTFAARTGNQKQEGSGAFTAGSYGLLNGTAGLFHQKGATAIAAGLLTNNSSGQPLRGTTGAFHNHTASLSWRQQLTKRLSMAVRTAFDHRRFSAQNYYTTFRSDTATEQVQTFLNGAKFTLEQQGGRLTLDLGYRHTNDRYTYNPSSSANQNKTGLWQATATWERHLAKDLTLVSGTQVLDKQIRSNDRGNHRLRQGALFLLLNAGWGPHLSLTPALRVEAAEGATPEWIPQLNLSFRQGRFQYRAAAGKTVRQPDFTERFNNFNKTLVTGGSIGNPDLHTEHSANYEAGADFFAGNTLKLATTVFYRHGTGIIDWVTTPYNAMPRQDNLSPAGAYALATNLATVNTTGAELEARFVPNLGTSHHLDLTFGTTWLHTTSSEPRPSFYIRSHAKLLTTLAAAYTTGRLWFSATSVFKQREPAEATALDLKLNKTMFLLNLKAGYQILPERLNLFTEADNLLNGQDPDLVTAARPVRWIMGGLSWQLNR